MNYNDKIISAKDLSKVFKRIYGSGDEFRHLQNAIEQTPESDIKTAFFHCVMDKELACWAVVNAEGLQCDICKNQHEYDSWCDKYDGECKVCRADCICRVCNGKSHFIFSPEKAYKMRNKMKELEELKDAERN